MKLSLLTNVRRSIPLATSIFTLTLISAASAADTAITSWNGTTTDFGASSGWSSGTPSSTSSAVFNATFTTSNQPQLTASSTVQGIWLASGVGKDVIIGKDASSRTINITGTATLSGQANAAIILDDSGNHSLTLGDATANNYIINLSNSTGFYVNNTGTLTLTGNSNLSITNGTTLTLGGTNSGGKIVFNKSIATTTGALMINTAGTVTLSNESLFTGGTTLTNGTININNRRAIGGTASTFTINGGTIANTSGAAITLDRNQPIVINSDFAFTGGSGITGNLDFGTGAISLGTAAGTTRTITANAGALILGGIISNGTTANSVSKAGLGTLQLRAGNTYTGTTTVNAGTLLIGSGGSINATSKITVASGATIQNNSGAAITGALTLTEGSSLITVGNNSSFTTSNGLELVGNLSDGWSPIALTNTAGGGLIKSGALTLTLSGVTAGTYDLDDSSTGFSGTFISASVGGNALTTIDGGATFTGTNIGGFNYTFTNSTNTLAIVTAVPEPSTWVGGGLILGLAAWSQRKRFAA